MIRPRLQTIVIRPRLQTNVLRDSASTTGYAAATTATATAATVKHRYTAATAQDPEKHRARPTTYYHEKILLSLVAAATADPEGHWAHAQDNIVANTIPPRKFTKSRARAPRGAPCASFLPLNSTVGGPWGAKRGAWWARVWHTCGTPIWAWHVATRVCRACEARGWFI